MVFLSILQPKAPEELNRRVAALRRKWEKVIAVHLLTGVELEQEGCRMKPAGNFRNPEEPSKEIKSILRPFAGRTLY
jgi:hypothetical protein